MGNTREREVLACVARQLLGRYFLYNASMHLKSDEFMCCRTSFSRVAYILLVAFWLFFANGLNFDVEYKWKYFRMSQLTNMKLPNFPASLNSMSWTLRKLANGFMEMTNQQSNTIRRQSITITPHHQQMLQEIFTIITMFPIWIKHTKRRCQSQYTIRHLLSANNNPYSRHHHTTMTVWSPMAVSSNHTELFRIWIFKEKIVWIRKTKNL